MPLFLILTGIVLLIASVRGTQDTLFALVKGEFTGTPSYTSWILAFVLVGVLGYVPQLRKFSIAMLALIGLAIFLRKGTGFFDQLTKATLTTGAASTTAAAVGTLLA